MLSFLIRMAVLLFFGSPLMLNAQFGIGFGWGGGVSVGFSTGRVHTVSDSAATWLESDVDEPPVFPGGAEAITRYFAQVDSCGLEPYELACAKDRKVLVWFIVERDGRVQEAWIDRGGCEALQLRTICAVLNMPVWCAGKRRGTAVRTRVRISVEYAPFE